MTDWWSADSLCEHPSKAQAGTLMFTSVWEDFYYLLSCSHTEVKARSRLQYEGRRNKENLNLQHSNWEKGLLKALCIFHSEYQQSFKHSQITNFFSRPSPRHLDSGWYPSPPNKKTNKQKKNKIRQCCSQLLGSVPHHASRNWPIRRRLAVKWKELKQFVSDRVWTDGLHRHAGSDKEALL